MLSSGIIYFVTEWYFIEWIYHILFIHYLFTNSVVATRNICINFWLLTCFELLWVLLQVELLGPMTSLYLNSWRTPIICNIATPFYILQQCVRGPVAPHPHQSMLVTFGLVGLKWHLTVIFIWIYLLSNAENIFMYLLSIHISPLEKCLFRYSAHF
jgi:hypothetical protein